MNCNLEGIPAQDMQCQTTTTKYIQKKIKNPNKGNLKLSHKKEKTFINSQGLQQRRYKDVT